METENKKYDYRFFLYDLAYDQDQQYVSNRVYTDFYVRNESSDYIVNEISKHYGLKANDLTVEYQDDIDVIYINHKDDMFGELVGDY